MDRGHIGGRACLGCRRAHRYGRALLSAAETWHSGAAIPRKVGIPMRCAAAFGLRRYDSPEERLARGFCKIVNFAEHVRYILPGHFDD